MDSTGSTPYVRHEFGRAAPAGERGGAWMSHAASQSRFVAHLSVLSKVGSLAGILDYEEVLRATARLSIPELADWCVVDVVDEGEIRRMEVAHRDPARAPLAAALRGFPLDHASRRRVPAAEALRSGRPVLVADYTEQVLRAQTEGEYLELARQLEVCSLLVVPVPLSSSRATMTFLMTSESGRRYGSEDVALAEELGKRVALIVDNARVHRELRRTEERFRVALAHSDITLFEQDPDGRYRWIYNPPPGYEAAEIVGRTNEELLPPADAARLAALDRAVLEHGVRVHEEVELTLPHGETRHMLVSQEPLRDDAGRSAGLTGAATDITEQKRAQEQLAQALAFRERMLGVLGHDLRNPLGAVRALATLLGRRKDLPEDALVLVGEIGRASQRMLELMETLLDFTVSRFKGGLPIAPIPTDLHEVCRAVVGELRAAEPDRVVELRLDGDGRGVWDPARMAQVVSNLVANALQHGAADGPVRVSVGGDDGEAVLEVENDGPAIAPELMPVLFEPFSGGSALRDASPARGLGLGLYIVNQVVHTHGGTVEVDSTPERGTTFTVRLPRATAPRQAAPRAASPSP
jgi:PAS domain S-box-containing protein